MSLSEEDTDKNLSDFIQHTEIYWPDDSCPVYSYILSQDPLSSFQMMTLRS